jgi:hypothetical protein
VQTALGLDNRWNTLPQPSPTCLFKTQDALCCCKDTMLLVLFCCFMHQSFSLLLGIENSKTQVLCFSSTVMYALW